MKRYDGRTKRNPRKLNDKPRKGGTACQTDDSKANEYKCLIRARLGDKKISAVIGQKDMNKFQQSYSNLIKGNISLPRAKLVRAKPRCAIGAQQK